MELDMDAQAEVERFAREAFQYLTEVQFLTRQEALAVVAESLGPSNLVTTLREAAEDRAHPCGARDSRAGDVMTPRPALEAARRWLYRSDPAFENERDDTKANQMEIASLAAALEEYAVDDDISNVRPDAEKIVASLEAGEEAKPDVQR